MLVLGYYPSSEVSRPALFRPQLRARCLRTDPRMVLRCNNCGAQVFHHRENLPLGGVIALQCIGDDHPRRIQQAPQKLAEEFHRRDVVPPALHQNIQDLERRMPSG